MGNNKNSEFKQLLTINIFIMKKRQLETLNLKKEVISKLTQAQLTGGLEKLKTQTQANYCTRSCTGIASCNQN